MRRSSMISLFIANALCAATASGQTRSQVTGDSGTKQAQTFFAHADVGMMNFDSEAAGSKDTRTSMAYEVGGWLGESRIAGIKIRSQRDEVPFELNDSESESNFTDITLMTRLWWFVPSIGVSLSEVNVEQADVETVGLFGTGVHAGLGITGSLYPGIVLNGNVMTVRSSQVYDKLDQGSKLGDREEADAHIAFDVTERLIDFLVGYHVRRYEIIKGEETFAESSQGVYAGVRLGVYF